MALFYALGLNQFSFFCSLFNNFSFALIPSLCLAFLLFRLQIHFLSKRLYFFVYFIATLRLCSTFQCLSFTHPLFTSFVSFDFHFLLTVRCKPRVDRLENQSSQSLCSNLFSYQSIRQNLGTPFHLPFVPTIIQFCFFCP